MKNDFLSVVLFGLALASGTAGAAEICDFSLNPDARDCHSPYDTNRYFTVCASERFEAHPSSVMLPDDRTIVAFWDYWQGGPCGPAAISRDAGRTWTRLDDRIPKEFSECYAEPKLFRFVDPKTGKGRLRVFASYGKAGRFDWRGADDKPLEKAMPSVMSEDDGETWKFLPPLGPDFACYVGFSGMIRLKDGSYLGVYSRGTNPNGDGGDFRVMGAITRDGGVTFGNPFEILQKEGRRFFLPTLFRSPDGAEICCLVGDLKGGAWTIFSRDEGKTWTEPSKTVGDIAGSEHSVGMLPDGRALVAFGRGELCGWLAPYKAFHSRKIDGMGIKLAHSYGGWGKVGTPNVHVRKDGEIVVVAFAQMDLFRPMPFVFAMRFRSEEVEQMIRERQTARDDFEAWNPFKGTPFKPLTVTKLYGPFAQEVVQANKKERTIKPFDGTKAYITKCGGTRPQEVKSKTGSYEIAKHENRLRGNAAILVWTVKVPADCKARLRLVGSPSARCYVGKNLALPAVLSGIFEPRTAEIELKAGENEIAAMVYQPKHREASEAGFSELPLLVAAGLDLADFKCVGMDRIVIKAEDDISIDDEMEADE